MNNENLGFMDRMPSGTFDSSGTKLNDATLAKQSGFIGTNNMGQTYGPKPNPVAGLGNITQGALPQTQPLTGNGPQSNAQRMQLWLSQLQQPVEKQPALAPQVAPVAPSILDTATKWSL